MRYLHLLLFLALPQAAIASASAQTVDRASAWQDTGRDFFPLAARRDSSAARRLYRALLAGDTRYLLVQGYGDFPIGLYKPEHRASATEHGSRYYTRKDVDDARVFAWRFFEPYHFAEYYNEALFTFLTASATEKACFLSKAGPFTPCGLALLPHSAEPPNERPEVTIPPTLLHAVLDSLLGVSRVGDRSQTPLAVDAAYGDDGTYSLARMGQHDPIWLQSLVARGAVTCVRGLSTSPPCPTYGPLTTVAINVPRLDWQGDTVIHVHWTTSVRQNDTNCGFGCFFGSAYDLRISLTPDGWQTRKKREMVIN